MTTDVAAPATAQPAPLGRGAPANQGPGAGAPANDGPAAGAPGDGGIVDAILVLQKSDLMRLAQSPALTPRHKLLFADPGLLDEAVVRGLHNTEFRRLPPDPDFQARAATEAMTLATLVDLRLTVERQALWAAPGPAPSLHGWDVGVFFLALQRALVARQIGAQVASSFPERRLGLLRPAVAQQMYFDSFVSTDLVASDPARFAIVDSYEQARWHRADAYDSVFDAQALRQVMVAGRVTAVTHVPTCFYDHAWLTAEVSRSHAYTLDLPSPFWDVPLHRGANLLRPLSGLSLSAEDERRAQAYRQSAIQVLQELLTPLLPQAVARQRQIEGWALRCHWQAINFLQLRQGMAGQRPQFLLSDQDAGLNGPLFSLADALGAPITVVPHSGHPSMLLPHARRVTAVERAGYGCRPRSVLGQSVEVRPVRFANRLTRQNHEEVNTVCLLLNSMQTEGLSYVDAHALAAFYKPLAALCAAAGVELLLRPKPGAPALSVLCGALGLRPSQLVQQVTQPLEQLAAKSQLCLAYGEPTTGVAPFLDGGSLVLQVNEQRWPCDYTVCLPLVQDGVIPLLDHSAALQMVQRLLRDPVQFRKQLFRQTEDFALRCRDAQDHLFDHPFDAKS